MLLDLNDLVGKYDLKITGILHVGAHEGEEAPLYRDLGIDNVWWIEANEDNYNRITPELVSRYGHRTILALITDKHGEETVFHITNYDSMSSSVLPFGTHPQFSPDTVFVEDRILKSTTLDTLAYDLGFEDVNFLNMDLQGAELMALKGAVKLLPQIDYVYTEVNRDEVYLGCAKVWELDEFLSDFDRVETGWTPNAWGDALYVRKNLV